ncbi:hypothetical protein HPB47_011326 [Ixodes persulcatus]|uniref:Uncharacterized protein n=1 Tax=Ixodes persulcatus TaxID=34615 RepID=A0AC60NWL3_IXOPE|nr:hypothetical protein HPB47_011326 [Ixodes persulcatus]
MVTIRKLATSIEQVTGMLRRIRKKRHELGEKEAIRLVQAFAISRITYGTAYLRLTKTELKKLNVVIKKALKSGTVYVDAARGQDGSATAALMLSEREKTISAESVKRIDSAARAEECTAVCEENLEEMGGNAALANEFELPFSDLTPTEREMLVRTLNSGLALYEGAPDLPPAPRSPPQSVSG